MASPEKYFARTADSRRVYPLAMVSGESLKAEVDWNQILGEKATTISASVFTADGNAVGVSGAANAGGVTSALFAGPSAGVGMVANVVTLANGEVLSRWWYVRVADPRAGVAADYA